MIWQPVLAAVRELARRRADTVDCRVWIPSCRDGLGVYVTAAAIGEVMGRDALRERVQIIGTSPSDAEIDRARRGEYPAEALADLPDTVIVRYFPEEVDGLRRFAEELRVAVAFARHVPPRDRAVRRVDLLDARALFAGAPEPPDGDLIGHLAAGLRPGGVLLLPEAADGSVAETPLFALEELPGAWERPLPDDATVLGASWRPRQPVRVVVVNEHQLFVRSLAVLLESMFGRFLSVVAVADEPGAALTLIDRHDPDLVVVDVSGPTSADLSERLARSRPDLPVLALVDDPHDAWREVAAGGAGGVLPRSASADELIGPLLAVAEGWAVIPPEALRLLSRDLTADRYELLDRLDDDQLQLWAWIADGKQDNEIAELLYVSPRTVKRRVGALLRELDVGRRVEAAELAGRLGVRARVEHGADAVRTDEGVLPVGRG